MQWILQQFEDTEKLADALDRLGIPYSWHKVVPFVGELVPEPEVRDPRSVVMFGSYTLWRYAESRSLHPGVFRIAPFVHEKPWQPFMLNGPDAMFLQVSEIEAKLADDGCYWFIRPVADSKEQAGGVKAAAEIREIARKVMVLDADEIPHGSLRPDTLMMLTTPTRVGVVSIISVSGRSEPWGISSASRTITLRAISRISAAALTPPACSLLSATGRMNQ